MFGVLLAMVCLAALLSGSAEARNVKLILPFATALEVKKIADRPTGAVKFFFGDQATPQILTKIGSYAATPKTGATGKSDERACHEALHWTLVALEKRAQQ